VSAPPNACTDSSSRSKATNACTDTSSWTKANEALQEKEEECTVPYIEGLLQEMQEVRQEEKEVHLRTESFWTCIFCILYE
jgi:hypothetical protein